MQLVSWKVINIFRLSNCRITFDNRFIIEPSRNNTLIFMSIKVNKSLVIIHLCMLMCEQNWYHRNKCYNELNIKMMTFLLNKDIICVGIACPFHDLINSFRYNIWLVCTSMIWQLVKLLPYTVDMLVSCMFWQLVKWPLHTVDVFFPCMFWPLVKWPLHTVHLFVPYMGLLLV